MSAGRRPGLLETFEQYLTDDVQLDSGLAVWGDESGDPREEIADKAQRPKTNPYPDQTFKSL